MSERMDEDQLFFDVHGVDVTGVLHNLHNFLQDSGKIITAVLGGSTILVASILEAMEEVKRGKSQRHSTNPFDVFSSGPHSGN